MMDLTDTVKLTQAQIMDVVLKMLLPNGYDAVLAARNEANMSEKAVTYEGETAVKFLGEIVKVKITFGGK